MRSLFVLLAAMLLTVPSYGQTVWPVQQGVRLDPVLGNRLKVRFKPEIPRALHPVLLEEYGLRLHHAILPFELSVTSRRNKDAESPLNVERVIQLEEPLLRSYVVEFVGDVEPERYASWLRAGCSDFDCCEPVVISRVQAVPDDPDIETQKMLNTIQVFDAWDVEGGSDTVVIGISDSGVLQDHEDLVASIAVNAAEIPDNGVDDDGNGFVDDHNGYNFATPDDGTPPGNTYNPVEGHGTGVAGICAATVNNAIGIAGVAGNCKIFPLKTMPNNIAGIVYGYESIMYCALNGIDIVNCSWGSLSNSCIDAAIVEYAIARGVAVVAAAGNHGTAAPFFPGSYDGVLNVGVTNEDDVVIHMSGHGPTVDVMAPGQDTWTTSNDGTYGFFCCTSGSSPIAAAVVGLVRSMYPMLGPLEACALVREAVDVRPWTAIEGLVDIELLPRGRVNALKAVTVDPDSMPSLEPVATSYSASTQDSRWGVGDTVVVNLDYVNILGPWSTTEITDVDIRHVGSSVMNYLGPSSMGIAMDLEKGDPASIHGLRFEITGESDAADHVTATLHGLTPDGAKHSMRLMFPITPTPPYRNLENDVMKVSVGDRARLGIVDHEKGQGDGLTFMEWCGQLFEGGLMIASGSKVVDAVRASKGRNDYFRPLKRFIQPEPLTGIVRDDDAPDSMRLGIELQQDVRMDTGTSAVYYSSITVRNVSDTTLTDVAVGWFYDFDLGRSPVHNWTGLYVGTTGYAVEIGYPQDPGEPIVAVGSVTRFNDGSAIAGGIDNSTTYRSFPPERKQAMLYSGISEQHEGLTDIAIVSGMRFLTPITPGQSRNFLHFIAMDTSEANLYATVQRIVGEYITGPSMSRNIVWPNPTSTMIQVGMGGMTSDRAVTIFDAQGRNVMELPSASIAFPAEIVTIDVRGLSSGTYYVRITADDKVRTIPFVVLK